MNPEKFNSSGNFGFLFLVFCGVLGRTVWDSASHLAARIYKTIQKVEEVGWEQSLIAKEGQIIGTNPDLLQINIELDQKDQWYQRPIGLILIGITIAVFAQWVNLQFGLVK